MPANSLTFSGHGHWQREWQREGQEEQARGSDNMGQAFHGAYSMACHSSAARNEMKMRQTDNKKMKRETTTKNQNRYKNLMAHAKMLNVI